MSEIYLISSLNSRSKYEKSVGMKVYWMHCHLDLVISASIQFGSITQIWQWFCFMLDVSVCLKD